MTKNTPNNAHRAITTADVERIAISYAQLARPAGVDPIIWLANGGPEVDAEIARFLEPAADALRDELLERTRDPLADAIREDLRRLLRDELETTV